LKYRLYKSESSVTAKHGAYVMLWYNIRYLRYSSGPVWLRESNTAALRNCSALIPHLTRLQKTAVSFVQPYIIEE
jgi:hypothetical protein